MSVQQTPERVLAILERVTQTDEVCRDPELRLFETGVVDSLGLVELIVGLEEEFDVAIAPAEIEREQWATPAKIVSYMQALVGN